MDTSQVSTIPADVQIGAPSQMSMVPGLSLDMLRPRSPGAVSAPSVTEEMQQEMGASQGSEVSMRASSEFERSRFRELGRQLAIVPQAQENRPALLPQALVPPDFFWE